jgi:membrane protease YdiL (CAAX protease family)
MTDLGPQAAAVQRLQALVVLAIVAVFVWGHQQVGLVGLLVMVVVWPPAVSWRPLPVGRVLRAYVPFAAVWLGLTIVYLQVMHGVGWSVLPQPALERLAESGFSTSGFALSVLGMVVLAPVFEEVIFRGYLFCAFGTVLPPLATQLLTAVLFGLAHGLDYALPIGMLALLFGWLRTRYQSLLPSIFAHAVHNGLTVAITIAWPASLELTYPQ